MAVVGVGVDAIEIARVRRAIERTPGLLGRLYTDDERARCTTSCGNLRFSGLAARFAGKEAVAKALGCGLDGFGFRDIEIVNNVDGKPETVLAAGAADRASLIGVQIIHLSLSTSGDLALAHAVAETGSSPR